MNPSPELPGANSYPRGQPTSKDGLLLVHRPNPRGSWAAHFLGKLSEDSNITSVQGPPHGFQCVYAVFQGPLKLCTASATPVSLSARAVVHNHDLLWENAILLERPGCHNAHACTPCRMCGRPSARVFPAAAPVPHGRTERSQQKLDGQNKTKLFITWPFQKTVAGPCSRRNT